MARRRYRRWNSCIIWFVTSFGALLYTINCISAADNPVHRDDDTVYSFDNGNRYTGYPDSGQASCPATSDPQKAAYLMIVSTLDGRVTALDVKNRGSLVWDIHADSKPLLSSSISNLEITQNGLRKRLIPSLDGGLYQYDGESIEAIPMTAEALLSSTFKVTDRTMMIGSKDVRSYGLDAKSGKLIYICTSNGCNVLDDTNDSEERDMLVVTRNTQTVRAVDAKNGQERWNFSVGQHQLELLAGKRDMHDATQTNDDDVTMDACKQNGDNDNIEELSNFEDSLKIIVPEGMVVAIDPDTPDTLQWTHKFESPIANAWILVNGNLKPVSVFDNKHIPALTNLQNSEEKLPTEPLLYVGMHRNQLYVQPSVPLQKTVHSATKHRGKSNLLMPRVAWKPYLISASSRTPILRGNHKELPMIPEQEGEHALTVWHENYPFDNGYYLYPDVLIPSNHVDSTVIKTQETDGEYTFIYVYTSLWFYWKEVAVISLLTSLGLNILLRKLKKMYKNTQRTVSHEDSNDTLQESQEGVSNKAEQYNSRYETDFEQIQCLGKGGFGIVFEAKNKVDECHYAIKRISLPNSSNAKEKVMREVKALAKLEHSGIVRFFHAWLESPPVGWQEAKDKLLEDSECTNLPTPCNSVTELGTLSRNISPHSYFESSNPFGGNVNLDQTTSESLKAGGSKEFSVSSFDVSYDQSHLFNIVPNVAKEAMLEEEDSLQVTFRCSDSEDSGSCSNIPFSGLLNQNQREDKVVDNNSFSIVFEDSGCGEKNSHSSSGGVVFADNSCSKHIMDIPPNTETNSCVSHSKVTDNSRTEFTDSAMKCANPPIPKLYLYIQMQLCRRETLKDWLSANQTPRDNDYVVLDIFDQILSAVAYVHDHGLMHRDLKPSNIFFSVDGVVKIGDFGLVTALAEEQYEQSTNKHNPFKNHTAQVGTTLYMSPEQVSGKTYDQKVDIFSLGMILFELLYPFSTQMERIRTLSNIRKRKFPSDFVQNRPEEKMYVEKLLSPDPENRPTIKEVLNSDLLLEFHPRHASEKLRYRTISSSSSGSLSPEVIT